MTDDDADADRTTRIEKIGRLQGIRQHLQNLESVGFDFLDLTNLHEADPKAESPYVIPGTFISEEVGGSITVLEHGEDTDEKTLAQENVNQMLRNFLPGGYKQRWGNFDLWRGAWSHDSAYGHADIEPMFEWRRKMPLTDLLGDVGEVEYTEIDFDPQEVTVYFPRSMYVNRLNKRDTSYAWVEDKGIVWTGSPPGNTRPLSSDPTTNYLWFKHAEDEFDTPVEEIPDSDVVTGYRFVDDHTFVRCYYGSLLTLYPKSTTQVESGIMRYRNEEDDRTAFVATEERSQLLTLDLNRDRLREDIATALNRSPLLRRDLQFSFLESLIWEDLFFETEVLDHEFQVTPLVEHLVGIDFWERAETDSELGVFAMTGRELADAVSELLPEESQTRLRLLGHETTESSEIARIIQENGPLLAKTMALCRNEEHLLDFAEDVLAHSAEHALSGWANELTGSGTSFELWYDVTFQERDADNARLAVYDPIQGGAGISKEVYRHLEQRENTGVDSGLSGQGRCHSGVADAVTIDLLSQYPDGSLYEVYKNDQQQFRELVETTLVETVEDDAAYSSADIKSNVDRRVRTLFETRELARFYSYIAGRYSDVRETIGRTPRPADIALHLDRHVFRDPEIRTTYERFASDSGRRDIAELGERLEELTVQCITACPDCLKTDAGTCIRTSSGQTSTLNRRLLTEVFQRS